MKTLCLRLISISMVWALSTTLLKGQPDQRHSFVLAPAKDGRYAPWKDPDKHASFYAGEIITLSGKKFRYEWFTDVVELDDLGSDWSGELKIFPDHIYLDHPGVAYPYRVTGYLDGAFAMITWTEFERWKKFGTIHDYAILYLQRKKEAPGQSPPNRDGLHHR